MAEPNFLGHDFRSGYDKVVKRRDNISGRYKYIKILFKGRGEYINTLINKELIYSKFSNTHNIFGLFRL